MNIKFVLCALLGGVSFLQGQAQTPVDTAFFKAKDDTLTAYCRARQGTHNYYVGRVRLDSLAVSGGQITLYYNPVLAQYPMREDVCADIYAILKDSLPAGLSSYRLRAVSEGKGSTNSSRVITGSRTRARKR